MFREPVTIGACFIRDDVMRSLVCATVLTAPVSVLAHDGHGMIPQGVLHYLAEPTHLVPLLAAVVVLAYVGLRSRRSRSRSRSRSR
jgi:hypothetical protein